MLIQIDVRRRVAEVEKSQGIARANTYLTKTFVERTLPGVECVNAKYWFDEMKAGTFNLLTENATKEISAYLTCSRQGDILAMKKSQIMDEGILIKQSKTSVAQIKAWSPRFAAAIKMATELPLKPGMSSIFIIHQPNASGYTRNGFNSRWSAAREAAKLKFPELLFDFTFHDLKTKGVSDLEGDLYEKRAITGHKNVEQTAAYDRKIVVVPVVGGQVKEK